MAETPSSLLKGNFTVKRQVQAEVAALPSTGSEAIARQLKQRALASLGGSMIYVDRTQLDWDPAQEPKKP